MKPRICVDFDGTIFDGTGVMSGCISALLELQKQFTIAIFSARQSDKEREQMTKFLIDNQVPFDEILPPKPEAVWYIDDKGIQFNGWDKICLS